MSPRVAMDIELSHLESGMIVGERAGLFGELIPHRDGGVDNLDLSGSALRLLGKVLCEQRLDNAREVLRDLPNVCNEILIERQIDRALAGIDVVAKLHVHFPCRKIMRMACAWSSRPSTSIGTQLAQRKTTGGSSLDARHFAYI